MKKPPSAFSSLLSQKCPQCRSTHIFKKPTFSWYFLRMHKHCPNCELDLNPEPGFYWGAMYINYGFGAGIAIVVSVLVYFLLGNPIMEVYMLAVFIVNLLLLPAMVRYSRLLMLYWLGEAKFKPEKFNPDFKSPESE